MDEGSKLFAESTGDEVRGGDEQAREGMAQRVAEHHEPPRVIGGVAHEAENLRMARS